MEVTEAELDPKAVSEAVFLDTVAAVHASKDYARELGELEASPSGRIARLGLVRIILEAADVEVRVLLDRLAVEAIREEERRSAYAELPDIERLPVAMVVFGIVCRGRVTGVVTNG